MRKDTKSLRIKAMVKPLNKVPIHDKHNNTIKNSKKKKELFFNALKRQFDAFSDAQNDEIWAKTSFYKPAYNFICRLDR